MQRKGAPLHRKSGMLFVYAMLTMCFCGTLIAAVRGVAPAVLVTMFYWLWRVRIRRTFRGIVGVSAPEAV